MTKNQYIYPASILAASFILAVIIGAFTFNNARSFDNVLSVTGSATERVTADTAKWSFSFSRRAYEGELKTAYTQVAADLGIAKKFLAKYNIAEKDTRITPVFTEEIYKYDSKDNQPRQFNVRQSITIDSKDPKALEALSKASVELSQQGVVIMADQPQYFYSKLSDLRVKLLGASIVDAKARATEIAKSAKTKVGALKSASSGVVQVLAPNSIDISDYGQYDTSSLEKDVMVTVRASFFVK